MVNYWIFVISASSRYDSDSKETVLTRMQIEKKWKVGHRTPSKNRVKKGDKMLLYKSGNENMVFIGSATLGSEFYYSEDPSYGYVDMHDIDVFKESIPIKPLIDSLSFIKLKKKWGLYLSGGINPINKIDYSLITKSL
jgi:predicted RNA-binding protein